MGADNRKRRGSSAALDIKTLEKAINKKWGEGTMLRGSDPRFKIHRISTGILSVDWALGGGFALGRHAEIYGPYAVGKTFITYRTIAHAQSEGYNCAFIDVERTYDKQFAKACGVNTKKLIVHRQRHGNQVIGFMETLLRAGDFAVIVLDSIAALLPKSELESDMEGGNYGTAQAKLMSQALRRLTAANEQTALIYINQLRDSIGSIFAKRSTTSGGRAMGFYAGVRLELSRIENIKRQARVVDPKKGDFTNQLVPSGHRVLVKVEKDKTGGMTGRTSSFVFDYRKGGIDHVEDLMYLGMVLGKINKKGNSWYLGGFEKEKKVGRKAFKKWLRTNVAIAEELEESIRELIGKTVQAEDDDE